MFFSITVPQITPIIFFNLIMQTIQALQNFTSAFVITDGGPMKSTYVLGMKLYKEGFSYFKMGYASAISWVIFLVIMLISLVVFGTSNSGYSTAMSAEKVSEHYDKTTEKDPQNGAQLSGDRTDRLPAAVPHRMDDLLRIQDERGNLRLDRPASEILQHPELCGRLEERRLLHLPDLLSELLRTGRAHHRADHRVQRTGSLRLCPV